MTCRCEEGVLPDEAISSISKSRLTGDCFASFHSARNDMKNDFMEYKRPDFQILLNQLQQFTQVPNLIDDLYTIWPQFGCPIVPTGIDSIIHAALHTRGKAIPSYGPPHFSLDSHGISQ